MKKWLWNTGRMVSLMLIAIVLLSAYFLYETASLSPQRGVVDAIIVLAGGKGRIEEGGRLFAGGNGKWLFLIGVDPTVKKNELLRLSQRKINEERVVLENASRNTLENALFAREIVRAHDVHSVMLVTSRYHMKRAELVFRSALPPSVKLSLYPVDSGVFRSSWWLHASSIKLMLSECYKYYMIRVMLMFGSPELKSVDGTGM